MNAPLKHPIAAASEYPPAPLVFDATMFRRMIDHNVLADRRVELANGVLVEMNAQNAPHIEIKGDLYFLLRQELTALASPLRIDVDGTVEFSDLDIAEPDIFVRERIATNRLIDGATLRLVIEIAASSLTDDLGRKASLYARFMVAEYWVVDVEGQVVHRMTCPSPDGYAERVIVRCGEMIESVAVQGLRIEIPRF